jgi:hypothetical protein
MTEIVKKQSFALANILSKFGIRVQHSVALEVMAQLNGVKDWNILAAQGKNSTSLTKAHEVLLAAALELQSATFGGPKADGDVFSLACAGDIVGKFLFQTRFNRAIPWEVDMAHTRLALEGFGNADKKWETLMFVTLVGKAGKWVVSECVPVTKRYLHNHTVTLTLERHNAYTRVACPLSGVVHKAGLAIVPFVEGGPNPLFEFIVPSRVWDVAHSMSYIELNAAAQHKEPVRMVVTVGEIVACFKQNLAEGIISN